MLVAASLPAMVAEMLLPAGPPSDDVAGLGLEVVRTALDTERYKHAEENRALRNAARAWKTRAKALDAKVGAMKLELREVLLVLPAVLVLPVRLVMSTLLCFVSALPHPEVIGLIFCDLDS